MYSHIAKISIICYAFVSISCFGGGLEAVEMKNPAVVADPTNALKEADKLFKDRGDLEKAREAIKVLRKARNIEKRNFEVEWKFARYSYFLGSRLNIDDEESEKVLKPALEAARIASRMEPDKPDGYFWYAAILGEQSRRSPVTVGVISVKKIKESMNKVIEIDPEYQGASAYDGLGQVELATRGLAGGSTEKALEYFHKALELNSNNSYIRLHLGQAYLVLNKDAEAKKHLEYVMNMKPNPDFLPEYEETRMEAEKLLDQKF